MTELVEIKQGSTSPAIRVQFENADGSIPDLTGATVRFVMARRPFTVVVDAAAVVTSPTEGIVIYEWQTGDTDVVGHHLGEFVATFADGKKSTFPNQDYIIVKIQAGI